MRRLPYIPRRPDFCGMEPCNLCFYSVEDPPLEEALHQPVDMPVAAPAEYKDLTHEMVEQIRRKAKIEVDAQIDKNFKEVKEAEKNALVINSFTKQKTPIDWKPPEPKKEPTKVLDEIDVEAKIKKENEKVMEEAAIQEMQKQRAAAIEEMRRAIQKPSFAEQRERERQYVKMMKERAFEEMSNDLFYKGRRR